MGVSIDEFVIADPPECWDAAGFAVDPDGVCRIGSVRLRLVGREHGLGIVGWSLRGVPVGVLDGSLDGVPATLSDVPPAQPAVHPNGVVGIDHAVLLSPDLARTTRALASLDVLPRRERDGELGGSPVRQIFFKFEDLVIEVVGSPGATSAGPSSLWGLTYVVDDIDATAAYLGERTSPVKDAIQPGRRITTVRHREFDMSVRTALISVRAPYSGVK